MKFTNLSLEFNHSTVGKFVIFFKLKKRLLEAKIEKCYLEGNNRNEKKKIIKKLGRMVEKCSENIHLLFF